MASSNIIAEFLVALGWKSDEAAQKQILQSIDKMGKDLLKLTLVAEATAVAVVAALGKMSKSFEDAYYSSSRTGASVREMNAFKYAASQMGSSAEEATAAVEGLALKIRENPGYKGILRNLGATDTNDLVKSLNQIAPRLAAMPLAQAEAFAKELSISDHLLLAMRQVGDNRALQAKGDRKYGILGFDPNKATEDGRKLSMSFRDLGDTFSKIVEKTGSGLFRDLTPQIQSLNDFLLAHGQQISDTLIKIGDALFKMFDWVVRHLPELDNFVESIGGWQVALTVLAGVVSLAFIGRMASFLASMKGLTLLVPPAWLLGILGLTGYAAVQGGNAAKGLFDQGFNAVTPGANTPEVLEQEKMGPIERMKRIYRRMTGNPVSGGRGGRKGFGKQYRDTTNYTGSNAEVVKQAAKQLGTSPEDLAMVISYETGGSFSPHIHGGKGGNYQGLIQFGPPERRQFGVNDKQTFAEQMPAVVSYLKTRGFKAGMGLKDLYSTINAGSPGHYGASDGNGTVSSHVARMQKEHAGNVRRFLQSGSVGYAPVPAPMKNPYGALNTNAVPSMLNAPPLGAFGSSANDNSKSVTVNDNKNITVNGTSDPTAAAAQVGSTMKRHDSMMLRNVQSAVI